MEMIRVTGGTTLTNITDVVPANTKIQEFLDKHNISTVGSTVSLNNKPVVASDLSKSFADLGVASGSCYLFSVVNSKNA